VNEENFEINNEENLAKTKYFSDFALKHFGKMKILKKGGILGKENKDWRNISEHCLVEAVGADILAEYLGADREEVVEAVLLHDWYKRREIEEMQKKDGSKEHQDSLIKDINFLRQYGIDERIIKISHSNIPEIADLEYLKSRPLEEKIMHFIDMITSDSNFMDFNERMAIARKKEITIDVSESYRDKYGGKSLIELQTEVVLTEQKEFEKSLNLQQGALINFIKEKLEERINNFR